MPLYGIEIEGVNSYQENNTETYKKSLKNLPQVSYWFFLRALLKL